MVDVLGGFTTIDNINHEFKSGFQSQCTKRLKNLISHSVFKGSHFVAVLSNKSKISSLNDYIMETTDHLTATTFNSRDPSPECWRLKITHEISSNKVTVYSGNYPIRPMYIYQETGAILYSTDFSLLAKFVRTHQLDKTAAVSLLAFGRVIDNRTLSLNIKRLPQAGKHVIRETNIISERSQINYHAGSSLEQARDCFVDLLKARIGTGSSVYIPLSGGIDSRTIAAAVKGSRCTCYTRGRKNVPEVKIAGSVAHILGFPYAHYAFPNEYLESFASPIVHMTGGRVPLNDGHAIYPCDSLQQEGAETVIPGIGGEIGRSFWSLPNSISNLDESPEQIAELLFSRENILRKYQTIADSISTELKELKDIYSGNYVAAADQSIEKHPIAWNDEFYLRERLPNFTSFGPLIWNKFFNVILPFLEEEYLGIVRALPYSKKSRPYIHASIISSASRELANIRLVPSGMRFSSLFPHKRFQFDNFKPVRKIIARSHRKPSAQNYPGWLRSEKTFITGIIERNSELELWEIIPQSHVKDLYQAHLAGKDHSKLLCRILTVLLTEILLMQQSDFSE